jgi:uncharacterized protein YqjF (DUF2071 family)
VAALVIRASRLRLSPPPPIVRAFPEVNLRTYATVDDRPGVVFLSLDADSALFVEAARAIYRIPYLRARIRMRRWGDEVSVSSRRVDARAPAAALEARFRAGGAPAPATPGSLAHWLVERYCLYAAGRSGGILRGDIAHPPWSLRPAEAEFPVNTLGDAFGLDLSAAPALTQAADPLHARFWAPRRVRGAALGPR